MLHRLRRLVRSASLRFGVLRRRDENAEWFVGSAKDACLRRLEERGFPREMRAVGEASERFFEVGVYYRNPLEVPWRVLAPVSRTVLETKGVGSGRRDHRRCRGIPQLILSRVFSVQPLVVRRDAR